jgi:hypothetical protein
VKNTSDPRPESYRPVSHSHSINVLGKIPADGNAWMDRREIVLKKVYSNLRQLIGESKNRDLCTSLAVFKPTKIIDFFWKRLRENGQRKNWCNFNS